MKAVMRQLEEIRKYQIAINKSKSFQLKNDYTKKIKKLKRELKQYCYYKKYSYKDIMKKEMYYEFRTIKKT